MKTRLNRKYISSLGEESKPRAVMGTNSSILSILVYLILWLASVSFHKRTSSHGFRAKGNRVWVLFGQITAYPTLARRNANFNWNALIRFVHNILMPKCRHLFISLEKVISLSCWIFNSFHYNILHCWLWGSRVLTWWCFKQSIKMSECLRSWSSV